MDAENSKQFPMTGAQMTGAQWNNEGASLDVRSDILQTQRYIWHRLGEPGTWWTGAERMAIAAETRQAAGCALCAARKLALSPFSVDGDHDRIADLPEPVVDIVHRISTDAGRLTRSWFDSVTTVN